MRPLFLDTLTTYRERRQYKRQVVLTVLLCGLAIINGLIALVNYFC